MAIKVYDWQGNERDLAYLKDRYGDFIIQPAAEGQGPAYKISVLRERVNTLSSVVVCLMDEAEAPLEGVPVAWYWPDAPQDGNAGPLGGVPPQMSPNRCIHGLTKAEGSVAFAMGQGAFYWPDQGQIGPHAVWVYGAATRSDLILGLGMVAGTNHDHIDVEFVRLEDGEPPEPPEPGECPTEEILAELVKIEEAVDAIRQLLDQ